MNNVKPYSVTIFCTEATWKEPNKNSYHLGLRQMIVSSNMTPNKPCKFRTLNDDSRESGNTVFGGLPSAWEWR
ncbi:hypothetical protein [Endozoicomonas euniceicola]|uniref:Uncharacterized protein n=1 Tax=Endozoicomonas euniceicola TaxID=1234143 RepID=A0ABY6GP13_9GAMM|nr:hypothetical protein [Endozoicomonas euniceicola]UYM14415.1 hypothetical protein NX720_16120 [Endozoicomonas euniceicola]